jgi:hypothetical protein
MNLPSNKERALLKESESIAKFAELDFHRRIEEERSDRDLILELAIRKMVIAEIVMRYTLLDESLSNLITKYFFSF